MWRWWNNDRSWVFVNGESKIMAGRGWSWVVAGKLWLVLGDRAMLLDLVMLIFRYFYVSNNNMLNFCSKVNLTSLINSCQFRVSTCRVRAVFLGKSRSSLLTRRKTRPSRSSTVKETKWNLAIFPTIYQNINWRSRWYRFAVSHVLKLIIMTSRVVITSLFQDIVEVIIKESTLSL